MADSPQTRPTDTDTPSLQSLITQLGAELGFAMTGITPAQVSDHADFLDQWLAEGKHGQMHYLANHRDIRVDPTQLLPGAQSVISVADRYPHETDLPTDPPAGRIARYAWGDDYHKVLKKRLMQMADTLREQFPDEQFRVAVDTAPILEREHAKRAGLGWVGKHTLLIHPQLGSWFALGVIVTTLDLPHATHTQITDHCGTCTRCIDACPTQCITPYQLDATKCISYLTLEHRSEIDANLQTQMGDWIAGCDICQEVCPHNRPRPRKSDARKFESTFPEHHVRYTPRPPAPSINLLEILNWTAADRQEAFISSALKRMKLEMVKRNAIIAAGNYLAQHDEPSLRKKIHELSTDFNESEMVRHTASDVITRLDDQQPE